MDRAGGGLHRQSQLRKRHPPAEQVAWRVIALAL
jgi:hypothetical protein